MNDFVKNGLSFLFKTIDLMHAIENERSHQIKHRCIRMRCKKIELYLLIENISRKNHINFRVYVWQETAN